MIARYRVVKAVPAVGFVAAIAIVLASLLAPSSAAASSGRPFAGAGTWVSIFSGSAVWDHPRAQVRRMHAEGVRTLYLQTASSSSPVGTDVYRLSQVARFLVAAHARGMRVVAWYLPPLRDVRREHRRAMAAIDFRTASGQRIAAKRRSELARKAPMAPSSRRSPRARGGRTVPAASSWWR